MIHKALYHHTNDAVSQTLPVDGMAYFSGLNLLQTVLNDKNFYTQKLTGKLEKLPSASDVFVTPVYQKSVDEEYHYVLVAKLILAYRVDTAGNLVYFFENFGGHNKMVMPRKDLSSATGTLLIPYDLVATIKKSLMPIDVGVAIAQNPYHPSFSYKLSPSPATSLALEHDLHRQLAFMTHPKMMAGFVETTEEEQIRSLSYDTRLALELLNTKYNIDVNPKALKELAEIDEKLANINGSACIEIN